jgi:glycosyltransferase involved in cell wall biosynthesis
LLRQQSVALGIGHEVDIAGPVPNDRLGEHFAGLDLFVLPSRSEAFALTVGEALSSGVPAIVTTAAPWGDVVVKGCGWSVAPSLEGLAKGLEEATALPPDVLRSMGQRGREWVRGAFSWEAVARRHLIELYGCPPGLAAEDAGGHVDCRPADPPSRWGV